MLEQLVQALIVFLVIMDPFSSLPTFISLTKKLKPLERMRAANEAVLVAAIPIVVFALLGSWILGILGITLAAFKIAGGIVLGIMGIELILSISLHKEFAKDAATAGVIIAIPLITGPAVITSSIFYAKEIGIPITLAAAALALAVVWAVLRTANLFSKLLGRQGMQVISRIMGLILVAIAVSMIQGGLAG